MYNQSCEEYMRSMLGYPVQNYNTYDTNENYQYQTMNNNEEIEECYPEIYKIVYPMVCKACEGNTKPVNKQLIDSMTNEIYMAIEGNQEVNVNINLSNNVRSSSQDSSFKKGEVKVENRNTETRQIGRNNFLLNDLIRILLIRELLGNGRSNYQGRPPIFPGRPPIRPNFPGRPPIMPREFSENININDF